jgi:aspartate carbamoyltransferase catalytic subunit
MVHMLVRDEVGKIDGDFTGKNIISLNQFTAEDLRRLFLLADDMKRIVLRNESSHILAGMLVSLLFFEPSSRTFGSFAAAVKRLGGQTIEVQNPETVSSVSKGESFEDTIRVFGAYADAIVLRHPLAGAAQRAALVSEGVPIVNAGDGNNEHPTQTLLDLYTLYEKFGRLDHLKGLLVGDALNSRTIHSLLRGLSLFPANTVYILAPAPLRLRQEDRAYFMSRGVEVIEIASEREIPHDCQFWYWTRIQKERLASEAAYQEIAGTNLVATPYLMQEYAGKDTILMDPLPRVKSVDPAVDADERAVYLRSQIRNGVYTRMALLALILGRA